MRQTHSLGLFLLLFLSEILLGQSNWYFYNTCASLRSVYFVNDQTGWVTGGYGLILNTTNGGLTWTAQRSGLTPNPAYTVNTIYFINSLTGLVGTYSSSGSQPKILRTTDGGSSWYGVFFSSGYVNSITFTNALTGYAFGTGTGDQIFKTVNGGVNWFPLSSGYGNMQGVQVQFIDQNTGFAIGGYTYGTTDAGNSWVRYGPLNYVTAMWFINASTGWFTEYNMGSIYKTINGGINWTLNFPGDQYRNMRTIHFINQNTGFVGGYNSGYGAIIKTTNQGTNWTLNTIPDAYTIYSIFFPSQTTGYTCGANGQIFKTTNAGSWQNVLRGPFSWGVSLTYYDVRFTGTNSAIAIGEFTDLTGTDGVICRTTNLGLNWTNIYENDNLLYCGYFVDNNIGWAAGQLGRVIKTYNGGLNWSALPSVPGNPNVLSMYFSNQNTGYLVGTNGSLTKSTDGGSSWISQPNLTSRSLRRIKFIDGNVGWICGDTGLVLKTVNAGVNWSLQYAGTTARLSAITFLDANTGYVAGANGFVFKSTNGGSTWNMQSTGVTDLFRNIYFLNANSGLAVGDNGIIVYTSNGGANWILTPSAVMNTLYGIDFSVNSKGLITGHDGIVLGTDPIIVSTENSSTHLGEFNVSQNYPNPFNPTTRIKFGLLNSVFVSIKIYNILGEEIKTLVDEQLQPGSHEVEWDASNCPSGVYFYRLTAGSFIDAKTMILAK